jgi:hypothetical protein
MPALRGGFLIPLAACAGYQAAVLFLLSGQTSTWFAWTFTSKLSAATMGAGYAAGLAVLVAALRLRRWVDVRLAYISTLVLVIAMLAVTLLHIDDTHLLGGELTGVVTAWLWLAVHTAAPVIGGSLLLFQVRLSRTTWRDEPRDWAVLVPVAVVGVIGTFVGIGALLFPHTAAGLWPWSVTTLEVRALGAWALTYGIGSWLAVWEADAARLRTGAIGYLVAGFASTVAMVCYAGEVRWGVMAWLYLAAMVSLMLLGVVGWWMAGSAHRWQPA